MPRKQSNQWEFEDLFSANPEPEPGTTPEEEAPKVSVPPVWSVGALTRQIRTLLEGEFKLVKVSGEVSNFRAQASGHCYFTLKDGDAQLSCVLFRGERVSHREQLEHGVKLILRGDVSVYMPRGQYQLIVRGIEMDGVGALQLAFERLKQKLKAEGLFEEDRKRPLPERPSRIGVVTSPTGAALRDVAHVLERRHPGLQVVVAGCRVQGHGAAEEIAASIRSLNQFHASKPRGQGLDLILVTRGGGSLEDLWAFNEEVVARAIAGSELPVVSAVGHEIDFTISDFVADHRAATPSAAAEWITESIMTARTFLETATHRMESELQDFLERAHFHLSQHQKRLDYLHPQRVIERHAQRVDDAGESVARMTRLLLERLGDRFERIRDRLGAVHPERRISEERLRFDRSGEQFVSILKASMEKKRTRLQQAKSQLQLLGPMQVLGRGYSITQLADSDELVCSVRDVKSGSVIVTRLSDGEFTSSVEASQKGSDVSAR
jgi:exodeoxyribonuclease VII large subunit